jgi:hypothetical protein
MLNINNIRILSQNVNRNYEHVSDLLETRKGLVDLVLIQEPPWKIIRNTVSTTSVEGEPVVGAPIHLAWMCMYRRPEGKNDRPRVIAYVSQRLRPF